MKEKKKRESKWVTRVDWYGCGHKLESDRHGYKRKWAEDPIYLVHHPHQSCPSCFAEHS
jgi:hypothetical protein